MLRYPSGGQDIGGGQGNPLALRQGGLDRIEAVGVITDGRGDGAAYPDDLRVGPALGPQEEGPCGAGRCDVDIDSYLHRLSV